MKINMMMRTDRHKGQETHSGSFFFVEIGVFLILGGINDPKN